MKRIATKLSLNRETIRALTAMESRVIKGGGIRTSVTDEMGLCCTQTITCLCSIVTDC